MGAFRLIHHQLNQRGARKTPGPGQRRFQSLPGARAVIMKTKHRRRMAEIDILRHQIKLAPLILRRRQQREDLPAVVVDHDQHQRRRGLTQQRQRVQIVERGEIADDRQRRAGAGSLNPCRRRQQAINTAGAAVAINRISCRKLRQGIN